jgi:hypothetical protein
MSVFGLGIHVWTQFYISFSFLKVHIRIAVRFLDAKSNSEI